MLKHLTEKTWIKIYENVFDYSKGEFDDFWGVHPENHHEIMIFGKLTPIPRFQKLYGKGSYRFSGTESIGDPEIPPFVEKCFEFSKKEFPEFEWNGALVNWYEDGSNYIGPHSDDEKDLVENSPILSFSFGAVRTFRLKIKNDELEGVKKIDFPTLDKSLIVMGGACQKEYKHEITKTAKKIGPRINVTIRNFKKEGGF